MEILGQKIVTGRRTHLEIKVASLYTRTEIGIPVIVEKSKNEGQTILVMAGIHGDEINGIEIIRRLLFTKSTKPTNGTIICIPIVNVMAFLNISRKFADGRDLNRSFPGSQKGSLASQLAYSINTQILPHADCVVDLHSGSEERFNYPQIRYDKCHEESSKLAQAFNAPVTLVQDKAPKGSIRKVLNDSNTPTIIFEGGKSKTIDEGVVRTGMTGVSNVFDYVGVREKKYKSDDKRESIHLGSSRWVRARHSGMFQPLAENGKFVKKGELLGFINGPYAQFQKAVRSPTDGLVFCVNQTSVVNRGDAIFHIGQGEDR